MSTARRIRGRKGPEQEEKRKSAQYLTFVLAGKVFGTHIACVREILEYEEPMEIPLVPTFIRGIINLRGTAVPVLDLGERMQGRRAEIHRRSCIVILDIGAAGGAAVLVGILVDGVRDVLDIADDDVEPRPRLGDALRADFIRGFARTPEGFLVLLEVEHLLTGEDLRLLGRLGDEKRAATASDLDAAMAAFAGPAGETL